MVIYTCVYMTHAIELPSHAFKATELRPKYLISYSTDRFTITLDKVPVHNKIHRNTDKHTLYAIHNHTYRHVQLISSSKLPNRHILGDYVSSLERIQTVEGKTCEHRERAQAGDRTCNPYDMSANCIKYIKTIQQKKLLIFIHL